MDLMIFIEVSEGQKAINYVSQTSGSSYSTIAILLATIINLKLKIMLQFVIIGPKHNGLANYTMHQI